MALAWECQESLLGAGGWDLCILGLDLGECLLFIAEGCNEGSVLTAPVGPESTALGAALALLAEGAVCSGAVQTWISILSLLTYLS